MTAHSDNKLPAHIRNDNNSLYEVFTMNQLIEHFNINNVTRRKASVTTHKLDFLNKMLLRSKAGRLGVDGDVVEWGKGSAGWGIEERARLVERYEGALRVVGQERGCDLGLVEDRDYLEEVFDLELPRVTKLRDLAPESAYFFFDPDYSSPAARDLYGKLKKESPDFDYGMSSSFNGVRDPVLLRKSSHQAPRFKPLSIFLRKQRSSTPLTEILSGT